MLSNQLSAQCAGPVTGKRSCCCVTAQTVVYVRTARTHSKPLICNHQYLRAAVGHVTRQKEMFRWRDGSKESSLSHTIETNKCTLHHVRISIDVSMHMSCCRPVLTTIPEGEWLCPSCSSASRYSSSSRIYTCTFYYACGSSSP